MAALAQRGRGVGDDCAVASLDDLALGYATALSCARKRARTAW